MRPTTIKVPGTATTCYISRRFGIVAELEDSAPAVMDFKTGNRGKEKTHMCSRQLPAYVLALENPAEGALRLAPMSKVGLVYFRPEGYGQMPITRRVLEGPVMWVEIQRDDEPPMRGSHAFGSR